METASRGTEVSCRLSAGEVGEEEEGEEEEVEGGLIMKILRHVSMRKGNKAVCVE